jgi:hypothetical protein
MLGRKFSNLLSYWESEIFSILKKAAIPLQEIAAWIYNM